MHAAATVKGSHCCNSRLTLEASQSATVALLLLLLLLVTLQVAKAIYEKQGIAPPAGLQPGKTGRYSVTSEVLKVGKADVYIM